MDTKIAEERDMAERKISRQCPRVSDVGVWVKSRH